MYSSWSTSLPSSTPGAERAPQGERAVEGDDREAVDLDHDVAGFDHVATDGSAVSVPWAASTSGGRRRGRRYRRAPRSGRDLGAPRRPWRSVAGSSLSSAGGASLPGGHSDDAGARATTAAPAASTTPATHVTRPRPRARVRRRHRADPALPGTPPARPGSPRPRAGRRRRGRVARISTRPSVAEHRVGHVDAVLAHALGELEQLLPHLRLLLGVDLDVAGRFLDERSARVLGRLELLDSGSIPDPSSARS